MRLLTPRLLLRPMTLRDAATLHAHLSRPEVARPAGIPRPRSLADTRARIRRKDRTLLALTLRRGGAWVGGLSIRWPHAGVAETGYSIHVDHWGNGYATEAVQAVVRAAFSRWGAHRFQATCWVENRASLRVLAKAGLRREGRLRGFLRRDDEVRDEYLLAMTKEDWDEKNA